MLAFLNLAATVPAVVVPPSAIDIAPFVTEASQRTGMPEAVIWAVMHTESRGQLRALSPKGAMGLMQLMPATWASLSTQHHLGPDPFDPHDNILAGAFYLRYLYDRYGWDGFLAAYNAGPGRYEDYRDTGLALPAETQTYVVLVAEKLAGKTIVIGAASSKPERPIWTQAALFMTQPIDGPNTAAASSGPGTPFVDLALPVSPLPQ